jgi:2-(1,2-epoxy-1,2-dihydrophenyl)acetyl-CoA isomerase
MKRLHESLLLDYHDTVAILTLNRAEVYNAIDLDMCAKLNVCLADLARNDRVRAVIVTGSGPAFCAGGDLRFAVAANPLAPGDSFLALTSLLHDCILAIRTMSKPVIAAVNGVAAGAGLFLALACDLRVMADTAYLKQSNTSYGLSLPAGGSFLLPRLVGLARALEIVMLDEPITARRAQEFGLVTRAVPHATLLSEAWSLAGRVADMPIGTLGRVKRLMNDSFWHTLEEQLQAERMQLGASANAPEGREGIAAFLEKRRPNYVTVAQNQPA